MLAQNGVKLPVTDGNSDGKEVAGFSALRRCSRGFQQGRFESAHVTSCYSCMRRQVTGEMYWNQIHAVSLHLANEGDFRKIVSIDSNGQLWILEAT